MTSAISICLKLDQSVSWWGSLLVFDDARRGLVVLFGKRLYKKETMRPKYKGGADKKFF